MALQERTASPPAHRAARGERGGQARPFDLETGRRHHFAQVAEAHMAAPGARHRSAATPQSKLLVEERSPEQSPVPLFR